MLLALLGCVADLLPDERVVGVDVPAEVTYGAPGSRLGAAVAWGDGWAALAPGADTWFAGGVDQHEALAFVGADAGGWVVATADGGWRAADGAGTVPGARRWATGPGGLWAATGEALVDARSGTRVPVTGVGALAVGEERVLAVVCDEGCAARAWTLDGVDLGPVAPAGEGGAVAEWGGVAWAGDPEEALADGAGRACAEDGRCVAGLPGDHLGAALGGGHAAGRFNKWTVPARTRLVPLDGGPTLAVEEGAENQPLALAGDAGTVLLGDPYHPSGGQPSGAVLRIPR